MSTTEKKHHETSPEKMKKVKSLRSGKKKLSPENLVQSINRQNEALNNIIKKFGETAPEKATSKIIRNKGKLSK